MASCLLCDQLSPTYTGTRYIIHDGQYWQLEHTAAPTSVKGWLRLMMKRHVEALHEIQAEEFAELSQLLNVTSKALLAELKCEKEYLMCFSEGDGTRHIHVHMVAKPHDLPAEARGANIFSRLNVPVDRAVSANEIRNLVQQLIPHFA